MNRPFCASNKQLERKWQDMAYQRHKEKLKAIKPRICQELEKNKQEENYRVQRRLRRVMGEERRQEMIAKQNHELLLRILNIMASPSRIDTWNVSYMNNTNARRERQMREAGKKIFKEEKDETQQDVDKQRKNDEKNNSNQEEETQEKNITLPPIK